MKRYDTYTESGISWIGKIPSHWEIKRGKDLFTRMAREVRESDEVITCFRDGEVTLRKNRRVEGFTESLKEIGYQGIRKGDLVIHQMDAFAGSIGVSDSDGKGTPVYICLQPKGAYLNQYYAHLLREMARSGYIKALYKGIRERSSDFRYDTFAPLKLPVPPQEEQEAIVAYLDEKCAQIDRYVASLEERIERLGELRQALIAEAVTRGINPQAPLRPSGIPWLGEIPQHWERRRCKEILTESKTVVGNKSDDYTLLSLTTNGVIVRDLSESKGKFPKEFDTYKVVKPDDLVFCLFDVDETPRTVGHVKNHGMLTGAYNVFSVTGVNIRYLYLYFIALDDRKALKPLYKGLRKVIPLPAFMSMPIYLPPQEEQESIVAYLDEKTTQIDRYTGQLEEMIRQMKDLRQTIISEAVTGKICVLPN